MLSKKAEEYAKLVHTGHFRRDEVTPYFAHLQSAHSFLVAMGVTDENMLAAIWLHDSVEDERCTDQDIVREFGESVAALVKLMSKPADSTYTEYIEILKNTSARQLKIADIFANLTDSPSPKQIQKYTFALRILCS